MAQESPTGTKLPTSEAKNRQESNALSQPSPASLEGFRPMRPKIEQVLREVDELKAQIEDQRPLDSSTEARIMDKFRVEWNFHSNAIEGNTLSHGETKVFLKHGLTAKGKPLKDYLDIKGHDEVLSYLTEFVNEEERLTEAVIREFHKILLVEPYEIEALTPDGQKTTKRVEIGTYKTQPNHVRTATGEIHHYASPEGTPARMSDLIDWYRRTEAEGGLHPLVLATLFHHEFTAIHPFDDGNGRMARILTNLILMRRGYPPLVVSNEQKDDYLYALALADDGDATELLMFFGETLKSAMQLYLRGARGEAIDELGDFDKRLALFQQSLETQKSEAETTKTQEAQARVFSDFVEPLFSKLNRRYAKIDRLFSQNKASVSYDTPNETTSVKASTRNEALEEFAEALVDNDILKLLRIEHWKGLKSHPGRNLRVVHKANFGEADFSVEVYHETFHASYDEPLTEEHVDEFASKVLDKIMERLERMTA